MNKGGSPVADIFFDFDSTMVEIETLDVLLSQHMTDSALKKHIAHITKQGMAGEISLFQSLTQRLKVAKIHQSDIEAFANSLPQYITAGLKPLIEKWQQQGHTIHILSGGFKDYMHPTAVQLNIEKSHIHANKLLFEDQGYISGLDEKNPLCQNHGKGKVIEALSLCNQAIMIGDGVTDLEVYLDGKCAAFIGFGLHAKRENVQQQSPTFVTDIAQFEKAVEQKITQIKKGVWPCIRSAKIKSMFYC